MFYQCTLPVQTIELKSVGVRLACRRAFVPAPDVGCSSRHLAERDPLNALARVARRAWTTEEMSGCGVEDVTALVACSNLVQGLDYLCVPVTAYVLWALSILRTTHGTEKRFQVSPLVVVAGRGVQVGMFQRLE